MNINVPEDVLSLSISKSVIWKKAQDKVTILIDEFDSTTDALEDDFFLEIEGPAVTLWELIARAKNLKDALELFVILPEAKEFDPSEIEEFIYDLEEHGLIC